MEIINLIMGNIIYALIVGSVFSCILLVYMKDSTIKTISKNNSVVTNKSGYVTFSIAVIVNISMVLIASYMFEIDNGKQALLVSFGLINYFSGNSEKLPEEVL